MKKITQVSFLALTIAFLLTGCSRISRENYDQIKVGMTADRVSEILGKPLDKTETDLSGMRMGKVELWVYSSAGLGGKCITISLQNGRVSDKSWSE